MSPASRATKRLRELYASVCRHMLQHEARLADPFSGRLHGIEPLEDRILLSGVTLIAHGFGGNASGWVEAMAAEIFNRNDISAQRQNYIVKVADPGLPGGSLDVSVPFASVQDFTHTQTSNPEITVLIDWSDIAGSITDPTEWLDIWSTSDVATAAIDALLTPGFLPSFDGLITELPIHMIGHSRGASLVGAMAEQLGQRGILVEHVTTLDPHPVDGIREPDINPLPLITEYPDFNDRPMVATNNVVFWDNYWRTEGDHSFEFTGEAVSQTYNLQLDENRLDSDGYISIIPPNGAAHSDTHLWYHGTIDTVLEFSDGQETIGSGTDWYDGSMGPRTQTGYYYSRAVGGDRPDSGVEADFGGTANRNPVSGRFGLQWPNITDLHIVDSRTTFGIGEQVPIQFLYQDYDSGTRVDFYLDTDQNPYNNNNERYFGWASYAMTGNSVAAGGFTISTSGTTPGNNYYLFAKTDDGAFANRVRYTYLNTPLTFETIPVQTGTALTLEATRWDDQAPGGDGDGVPEFDETVSFEVKLQNTDGVIVENVEAVLTTLSGGVQILDPLMSWGTIDPGEREWSGGDAKLAFTLGSSTDIVLSLEVTYSQNNLNYVQTFNEIERIYAPVDPVLAIDHLVWDAEPWTGTNGNGVPESGESGKFDIYLTNTGGSTASNITARIIDTNVGNATESWQSYPDLQPGDVAPGQNTFRISSIPTNFDGIVTADIEVIFDGASYVITQPLFDDEFLFDVDPLPWASMGPSNYDFGVLGTDEDLLLAVTIQNNGTSILTVTGIATSDTDTTIVELPGDPLNWTIEPGGSKPFTVSLETSGLQGLVTRQVTVSSDGGLTGNDQDVLTITGLVSNTPPAFQVPNANPIEWTDVSDNVIVWTENRGGNLNVFAYDLSTAMEHQITSITHAQNVRIDNNLIVWESYDALNAQVDIYAYSFPSGDLALGQYITVIEDLVDQELVGAGDGIVVYANNYDGLQGYDLQIFDLPTMNTTPVAGFGGGGPLQTASRGNWDIGDRTLTWIQRDYTPPSFTTNPRVMKYEIGVDASPVVIRSVSTSTAPSTHNGQVIWTEKVFDVGEGSSYDQFFLWNNGFIQQITTEPVNHGVNENLALGDGALVYSKDGAAGLFGWGLATGTEYAISQQFTFSGSARIDNKLVIWNDSRGLNYSYLEGPELSISASGINFSNEQPTEGDVIDVSVTVSNLNLWPTTQAASVQLYDGDPTNGGTVWGGPVPLAAPIAANDQATANFIGLTVGAEGSREIYAVVTVPDGDNPVNNIASRTLLVQDGDTEGPAITAITVTEESGDGDGLIGDDEQIRFAWTISDPSGVDTGAVGLTVNGIPVAVTYEGSGNYSAIVAAPSSAGNYGYEIQATDLDVSPEANIAAGTIEVYASEELAVRYNGAAIALGGQIDLGVFVLGEPTSAIPIIIRNDGNQLLALSGLNVTWTSGTGTYSGPATSTLAPGEFTTFTVSPDATLEGGLGADVVIYNSDLDPLPFELSITGRVAPRMPGDLNTDWFVGIQDLNTVLSAWNQTVAAGDLLGGDPSGDGFVGIEDLNLVLTNWNNTLQPLVEGDLDGDGFVGIADLNIVLGAWNQTVTAGRWALGDPSGDGFVGIEDLNTVLGNWNVGTPPTVTTASTSTQKPVEFANSSSTDPEAASEHNRRSQRRGFSASHSLSNDINIDSRAAVAAWNIQNHRSARSVSTGYIPWSLQQEEGPIGLGLWEELSKQ